MHEAYRKSEHGKEMRNAWKKTEKGKACNKRYENSNNAKDKKRERNKKYDNEVKADNERFGGNRSLALQRDNHKCVLCGSSERLQVHYIDHNGRNKDRTQQNNSLGNLITLCARCHIKQHNPVLQRWQKAKEGGDANACKD